MKAQHVNAAQYQTAKAVLRSKDSDKAAIRDANQTIAAYEKQKTPEHRKQVGKQAAKDIKAALSTLSDALGLDVTLTRVAVTPRGIVNIGLKAAPEGTKVTVRAELVH
jgi:uncharacterized protein (UPF0210 family)